MKKTAIIGFLLALVPFAGYSQKGNEVKEYTDFLYKYMAGPDRAAYSRQFFESNVEASLRAREEMPWGKIVPEREFRHFVLPVRVNNENLDNARTVFYNELKDRVKGMDMKEAVLEINHWLHEKVTYQPSDGRTSSPLSCVSQAIGRCGEESTFGVAAFRAMGIPARQVYTPRWAHTDDNHAWVEVWADGEWHFLGACEPEPILDLAWFNTPASRGMLMTTKVFGSYDGPEEVLETTATNTVINVTPNYAPVHKAEVKVTDTNGKPAVEATVRFCLYNYGEFYPVATKKTGNNGKASLTTGIGDLVAWATDGKHFGFALVKSDANGAADVVLDKTSKWTGTVNLDIVPPAASASLPQATPEQRKENDRRMAYEDSIRRSYTSTFATEAIAFALSRLLSTDSAATVKVLTESRGNHANIEYFLRNTPKDERAKALSLLLAISEKDRRDISLETLQDHITTPTIQSPLFDKYVLNPRVENEMLVPYKKYFGKAFSAKDKARWKKNPLELAGFIDREISPDTVWNRLNLRMDPVSVWKSRSADKLGKGILFVAISRSIGVPSRIDPVTGKVQYDENGVWKDAFKQTVAANVAPQGKINFTFEPTRDIPDPKYYSQFSLSKIENGLPKLLEFGEDDTAGSINIRGESFDAGQYMLVTGQRLANGGVLAKVDIFEVKAGETAEIPLEVRHDDSQIQVIGSFNSENLYHDLVSGTDKSLLSTTGRGYYVIGIVQPNHEPSEHNLNDLSAAASDLEKWGGKIVVLLGDKEETSRFDSSRFPNLPTNVVWGADIDGHNLKELVGNLHLPTSERPVFAIADTFNRVVFVSQGYTIGLGETLSRLLSRLGQ